MLSIWKRLRKSKITVYTCNKNLLKQILSRSYENFNFLFDETRFVIVKADSECNLNSVSTRKTSLIFQFLQIASK